MAGMEHADLGAGIVQTRANRVDEALHLSKRLKNNYQEIRTGIVSLLFALVGIATIFVAAGGYSKYAWVTAGALGAWLLFVLFRTVIRRRTLAAKYNNDLAEVRGGKVDS